MTPYAAPAFSLCRGRDPIHEGAGYLRHEQRDLRHLEPHLWQLHLLMGCALGERRACWGSLQGLAQAWQSCQWRAEALQLIRDGEGMLT